MIRGHDTETLELITDDMLPPRRLRDNVAIARQLVLIPIAPGSQEHQCTCGEYIYFGIYPSTKRPHPVSLKHDQAIRPTSHTAGQGVSHIPDCPHRDFHLGKVKGPDRRFFDRRFRK
jgi:hypothetical protein